MEAIDGTTAKAPPAIVNAVKGAVTAVTDAVTAATGGIGCSHMLLECPEFTVNLHERPQKVQFPHVLVKREVSASSTPTFDDFSAAANNANDVQSVLSLSTSALSAVANVSLVLGEYVPYFNLGVKAGSLFAAWGNVCSDITFEFCGRSQDTMLSRPLFFPRVVSLETFVYFDIMENRISRDLMLTYFAKYERVPCLKAVMEKIANDCDMTVFSAKDHKYQNKSLPLPRHCEIEIVDPQAFRAWVCGAELYLPNGGCGGTLANNPKVFGFGDGRALSQCEKDALAAEMTLDGDKNGARAGWLWNHETDGANIFYAQEERDRRYKRAYNELQNWIREQNNEHLESLDGCMRITDPLNADGIPADLETFHSSCFRKLCGIPKSVYTEGGVAEPGVEEQSTSIIGRRQLLTDDRKFRLTLNSVRNSNVECPTMTTTT